MTALGRKVVADFWRERTRTALVILAIATGIAGFSTVLSTWAILTRELNEGYLATNPASARLWTDSIDADLLEAVRSTPGVGDVEARRTVAGRIKVGPMAWRNLRLFVVEDYGHIRISTIEPEQGEWPPKAGEILIERDALQVAKAAIGDTVTVRTTEGTEREVRVTGSVHDVGQAQARMENMVYGYVTLETLTLLEEAPRLDRLEILVSKKKLDEEHIRGVVARVSSAMEEMGHPVRRVEIPKPGKHPHAEIMGLLLLWQASFGLFVLILSGVLVVNLLMAIMASQARQIGMMKAVGGTRAQIAGIYLVQAMIQGLIAVAIALPVGLWGSRVFCRYMAGFLNFDIHSFAVPWWIWCLVALVGLVVPVLAAAYPVWTGTRVTVREAISEYGVARNGFGTSAFDRILARIGGLARPVLLAIRNGFRRRVRLVLTVMTLTIGGLFFMSALNIRASLIGTLDSLFRTKRHDLAIQLGTMHRFEELDRAVRKASGVRDVEGWIVTEGAFPGGDEQEKAGGGLHSRRSLHGGGGIAGADSFPIIALPPDTRMLAPMIVEGRALGPDDLDAIVINTALAAREPRIVVGEMTSFQMGPALTSWRVVGIAREPFSPPVAYIPLRFFEKFPGHAGTVNSIRLDLAETDEDSIDRIKLDLEQRLAEIGVRPLSSNGTAEGRYGFDQHMLMIYVFLIIMSCLIVAVGGLGLMTTMSLNVMERRREMGVMRAIGASPRTVWLIVVAEGAVIGLMSWVLAAMGAWPLSRGVGDLMVGLMFKGDLDFIFETKGLVIWLAVSLALGAVASFVPAWHASRVPVREALEYE